MAYRPIEIEEKDYKWFENIGDTHAGVYMMHETVAGKFGDQVEYTFRNKQGDFTITPPANLAKKLAAAQLKKGDKCIMKFVSKKPMGEGKSDMKIISLAVEDANEKSTPPPVQAPPPAAADDDLPF